MLPHLLVVASSASLRGRVVPSATVPPNEAVEQLRKEAEEIEEVFDWDAHIGRLVQEDMDDRQRQREEEAMILAGDDEWIPSPSEVDLVPEDDEDLEVEPEFFKQKMTDVDPEAYNFRNVPDPDGCTWSRIRNRRDWWQFDDQMKLKEDEGFVRFDYRSFSVPDSYFEADREFRYGHIDLHVVAKIMPALKILGGTVRLCEAHGGYLRFKYVSAAKHRPGIEAYAKGLILQTFPELEDLVFESYRVVDDLDGASTFVTSKFGRRINF